MFTACTNVDKICGQRKLGSSCRIKHELTENLDFVERRRRRVEQNDCAFGNRHVGVGNGRLFRPLTPPDDTLCRAKKI
jgi:hypothetical protein